MKNKLEYNNQEKEPNKGTRNTYWCRDTCLHTQESYKNPKHKAIVHNQRFFKIRRETLDLPLWEEEPL